MSDQIKDIQKLADGINLKHKELEGKIGTQEEALKKVNAEIEEKGLTSDLKSKLTTISEEYNDSFKALKDLQAKQQEQVDAIETKLKRTGPGGDKPQNFKQHVRHVVDENLE